jgi:tRNA threonylcarbamoyladenosine biosynthesis protein TsaE
MTVVLHTSTPAQTRRIGERIGRTLGAGDVVLLSGDLGAGKTVLAQGIGRGLGIDDPIKSSSFVIMNEYQGPRLRMYHADLYRLEDPAQAAELALDELAASGVLVVEWPERAPGELPPEHLHVQLAYEGAKGRVVTVTAGGDRYGALLHKITPRPQRRREVVRQQTDEPTN